jgi:hypothetical protein
MVAAGSGEVAEDGEALDLEPHVNSAAIMDMVSDLT